MTGFLYQPRHQIPAAWSVYRTYSLVQEDDVTTQPVTFDQIDVNVGGVYDVTTGIVTAHARGVYYVHLTVTLWPATPLEIHIMFGVFPSGK